MANSTLAELQARFNSITLLEGFAPNEPWQEEYAKRMHKLAEDALALLLAESQQRERVELERGTWVIHFDKRRVHRLSENASCEVCRTCPTV